MEFRVCWFNSLQRGASGSYESHILRVWQGPLEALPCVQPGTSFHMLTALTPHHRVTSSCYQRGRNLHARPTWAGGMALCAWGGTKVSGEHQRSSVSLLLLMCGLCHFGDTMSSSAMSLLPPQLPLEQLFRITLSHTEAKRRALLNVGWHVHAGSQVHCGV